MPDAEDEEAVSGAAHEAPDPQSLRLPQSRTDATQTNSQFASVPANTSNSSGTESRVTGEIKRFDTGIFILLAARTDVQRCARTHPARTQLEPYDQAAILRQFRKNKLRIELFEELSVSLEDLTFDLDTLLLSARGVEEAQLQAMMEDGDIWGNDEV